MTRDDALMALAGNDATSSAPQRFLIITDINDSSQVVLRQAEAQKADSATGTNP